MKIIKNKARSPREGVLSLAGRFKVKNPLRAEEIRSQVDCLWFEKYKTN
jgi:hypothetical protein